MINSLAEATKVGKIYTTTNFKICKRVRFNRGEKNGIEPARLAYFKKLYESGKYFNQVSYVLINLIGEIIDGTHRHAMHEALGIPVNIMVTDQEEFNSEDEAVKLLAIATYNAKDSKWQPSAHFNAAYLFESPLALRIYDIKSEYENTYKFKKNLLTPSRIYAVLTHDRIGLAGKGQDVSAYCNSSLVPEINSDRFNKEFSFICAIMNLVIDRNKELNSDINPFFVIRVILPMIWDNELNMEKFYSRLVKYQYNNRFMFGGGNLVSVGYWIEELLNKPISPSEIITW